MARVKKGVILGLAREHWESYHRSRTKAILLDRWVRGEQYDADPDDPQSRFHGKPYSPRESSEEFENLESLTPTPWGGLIVTSLAQTLYVDGVRRAGTKDNMSVWDAWQRNRWDSKQTAIHRAAIGLSTAYGLVLPGKDPLTGDKGAKMLARSPKKMAAWYDDDDDEWCQFALEAEPFAQRDSSGNLKYGWNVRLYDEVAVHYLVAHGDGIEEKDWEYVSYEEHPMKVPPVARLANRLDLDGKATGEIEPILPLLRRVDQDTFDRLIVQRFGAWKVRYIAGMAKPDNETQARMLAMKLRVEDLLISGDHETKFGTLDATPIDGFLAASDADLRTLAAITQTPPHHLLGLSSNLQAEALAVPSKPARFGGGGGPHRQFKPGQVKQDPELRLIRSPADVPFCTALQAWRLPRWPHRRFSFFAMASIPAWRSSRRFHRQFFSASSVWRRVIHVAPFLCGRGAPYVWWRRISFPLPWPAASGSWHGRPGCAAWAPSRRYS